MMIKNLPDRTNIKSYILDCGHNGHWEKPGICAEIINTELLHNLPKNWYFRNYENCHNIPAVSFAFRL